MQIGEINMQNKCHIIGAGEICDNDLDMLKDISDNDIIIAADGGYSYLVQAGIKPDVIIGDFDSYKGSFLPQDIPVIRLRPEKDFTDIHTCIQYGMEQGFNTFDIYGAAGGRIDHTISNIQLAAYISSLGMKGRIFGRDNIYMVLHNSSVKLSPCPGYVSVFSLSDHSYDVSLTGFKYNLKHATLTNLYPLGVSNEFTDDIATVDVKDGYLLIILPR